MIEIRGFNPKLRHAEQQLETLRTPEGEPVPANTLAELKRDMQRRRFLCDQPVDPAIGTTHLGQRIVECVSPNPKGLPSSLVQLRNRRVDRRYS